MSLFVLHRNALLEMWTLFCMKYLPHHGIHTSEKRIHSITRINKMAFLCDSFTPTLSAEEGAFVFGWWTHTKIDAEQVTLADIQERKNALCLLSHWKCWHRHIGYYWKLLYRTIQITYFLLLCTKTFFVSMDFSLKHLRTALKLCFQYCSHSTSCRHKCRANNGTSRR